MTLRDRRQERTKKKEEIFSASRYTQLPDIRERQILPRISICNSPVMKFRRKRESAGAINYTANAFRASPLSRAFKLARSSSKHCAFQATHWRYRRIGLIYRNTILGRFSTAELLYMLFSGRVYKSHLHRICLFVFIGYSHKREYCVWLFRGSHVTKNAALVSSSSSS